MVTKGRFLTLLLAGLLLIAQQTALVHAAWHAMRASTAAHGESVPGEAGSQSDGGHARLCVFDAVLGQVLGGASGSHSFDCPTEPGAEPVVTAPGPCCAAPWFPFSSRAPPVLL